MSDVQKIIFIVGPTAVSKSDIALHLAKNIKTEIVSCDAMQVYKETCIATNKPSKAILKKIRHHLIDVVSVDEEFDVVRFNNLAVAAIYNIHERKKIPLVVGGSGLYMQVLLDGIFQGPPKDEKLREILTQQIHDHGNEYLYEKLKKVDAKAAGKIHVHDTKRIIRALEVFMKEQKPFSELQQKREGLWGKYIIYIFGLNRERKELYEIINRRVEQMFDDGLIEEIKKVSKLKLSQTALRIIGVREVRGYLNGEYDLARAKELMKTNTRRYAKRQLTWFKKDKRVEWFLIASKDSIENIVDSILEKIN